LKAIRADDEDLRVRAAGADLPEALNVLPLRAEQACRS
jgi:hypothetical protein